MTDDLGKRLREVGGISDDGATRWYINPDGLEAADRIETLEAELHSCFHRIEELQAALRELACKCVSNCDWEKGDICPSWTARKALEGEDE